MPGKAKIRLYEVDETCSDDYLFSFTIHHIAADGWSLGLFVNELVTQYEALTQGKSTELPALTNQYADYALWLAQDEQQQKQQQQLNYWKDQLSGVPNLDLPLDFQRKLDSDNTAAIVSRRLDADSTQQLNALGRANDATLFMTLTAALSTLLHRYSQQSDFCIGTPIAGRSLSQLEPLIGCFINVLAIRCEPEGSQSFSQILQNTKATCTQAFAHQDIPFERLVNELVHERDLTISPLFQVMLSVQNAALSEIQGIGMRG